MLSGQKLTLSRLKFSNAGKTMRRYVARDNIKHFEQLLLTEADLARRVVLEKLLAAERHELDGLESIWSWTCPHLGIPSTVGNAAEKSLDRIVERAGANYGSLQLWDDPGRCLRLIAHSNFDRSFAERFSMVHEGDETASAAALRSKAPVIIEDVEEDEAFASLRGWTRARNIRAIHAIPVFARSRHFIGAFSTFYIGVHPLSSKDSERNVSHAEEISTLFGQMAG